MALSTFSVFYYGLKVTSTSYSLDFDDGAGEVNAEVPISTYDFTGLLTAVKDAMDAVGTQEYTVTVDRDTRLVTISASGAFDLLLGTGSLLSVSIWSLLGFTRGSDLTGTNTYTGASPAGSAYYPQFVLQDYTDPDTNQERQDPSVNESASGVVEVISFGLVRYIEMSFKYITDIPQDGHVIKNNSSGVADAVDFFEAITERGKFEFMPSISSRSTYYTVVLDELSGSKTGTGFKLRELTGRNLPNYYELNDVKLRVIE